ncbi:uncharacterized protein LOC108864473 [Galendromus occidentalis]|uniref:Uncharacterized protein LOC108864473 n=1 Tax=Galendromus occidentalis TaxID=34638 RepID=A0AAJ7PA63_9ACAR|nr:uncharacterized protein LOC108864473 [Galendromus occidentalis]
MEHVTFEDTFEELRSAPGHQRSRLGETDEPRKNRAEGGRKTPRVCRFHAKFVEKARNCPMPRSLDGKKAPVQRNEERAYRPSVLALAAGSQPKGDLFFVQCNLSGRRFLVDPGAQVSMVPPSQSERGTPTDRHLLVANHSNINTYVMNDLSLNLAGRFTHVCELIIADVTHPILGYDFLRSAGLLVDLRGRRLLDNHSLVSIPLQPARFRSAIGNLTRPGNEF